MVGWLLVRKRPGRKSSFLTGGRQACSSGPCFWVTAKWPHTKGLRYDAVMSAGSPSIWQMPVSRARWWAVFTTGHDHHRDEPGQIQSLIGLLDPRLECLSGARTSGTGRTGWRTAR